METLSKIVSANALIVAFLAVALITWLSMIISQKLLKGKIPGAAMAILGGLILAFYGGKWTGGNKGIADLPGLSGFALLGSGMLRDFSVVATAMGSSLNEMKKTGWIGAISLVLGVFVSFFPAVAIAYFFGYRDAVSMATIGAGACTFIVGPVTGAALGADSSVIAVSIAAGVFKSVFVTIFTAPLAKWVGLDSPQAAMAYGGLMGTTSGVTAGLAATDPKLVPYGAMTSTFATGVGCLLCPSICFFILRFIFGNS
jgi:malonate transporter MadM subunit